MSRNTIPLGRWFAIAADTRLVGRWQVFGSGATVYGPSLPRQCYGRETCPRPAAGRRWP